MAEYDFGEVDETTRAKMRANTRTDTRPEVALRSALHRLGLRFRKDYKVDVGLGRSNPRPDIAFTRTRVAVFVDGCYWHGCSDHGHVPRTNSAYWEAKFEQNKQRDQRNTQALEEAGWRVLRIWEHVATPEAAKQVAAALQA